ncbi:hypothetical protein RCG23_14035 [Neobacillus sp. PS3-34]|uniref:hypothetical protein n=1 Tax=Neobacillus sp. PS3-34 TaxID=3070678 RepID=UPI0027DFBF00|nr:hypothetical protein [Neobacillus sp. PS3-34]WML46760.1 hypothetical protein RCG23_14035 [Neobacillus sp. PS3-34]
MFWGIVFFILNIAIIFYVIFSLSTIKYQLKLISKHLNVKEEEIEKLSNEEIEKELENNNKGN